MVITGTGREGEGRGGRSKHQAPRSREIPNPKLQIPKIPNPKFQKSERLFFRRFRLETSGFGVKIGSCSRRARGWLSYCGQGKRFLSLLGPGSRPAAGFRIFGGRKECGRGGSRFITMISCGRKRRGWSIGIISWKAGRRFGTRGPTPAMRRLCSLKTLEKCSQ